MKKTRDWLDYASLGAEAVQAAQLSSISSNLENLARVGVAQATAQAERQDREQLVRDSEDRIREFVFQGERLISDMRKRGIDANPGGALFVASRLRKQIATAGITTNRVRDYRDKECIQRLNDSVAEFCADCEQHLSPGDSVAVQKCLEYQAEEPRLREAIDWAERNENAAARRRARAVELEQKQKELDSIQQKTESRFHPAVWCMALVLSLLSFVFVAVWWERNARWLLLWVGAYFTWIFLAGIMRRVTPEVATLQMEIEALTEETAELVVDDAAPESVARFGKRSLAEFKELLRERQQAIGELLEPKTAVPSQK
jgi:hypothetical protein